MKRIVRITKNKAIVEINGRTFKIDNVDVEQQMDFMEKVVPEPKEVFSFAQFFEPVPTLES